MSKRDKLLAWTLTAIALLSLGGVFLARLPHARDYSFSRLKQPEEPKPVETTLFFVGDIMLSRNVGAKIEESGDPELPFRRIADKLQAATVSFANLESPFLDKGPRVREGMVFKAEPEYVAGLMGFDVLQTANNHSADRGKEGLSYTHKLLSEKGIVFVGTGDDCHAGKTVVKNGLTFGFLAYSYAGYNDGGKEANPLVCDWNDATQVETDIRSLRPKVDVLVVAPHMGIEYKRFPEPGNADRARQAIDSGADFVIGTHPHWIQTQEQYRGKWIFYSLGNFVFDQMWSQDTKEGLTVSVTYRDKELKKVEVNPVIIDNYCCPRFTEGAETDRILKKMNLTTQVLLDKN